MPDRHEGDLRGWAVRCGIGGLLLVLAIVAKPAFAEDMPGRSEMLDRVIALTDRCQQRQLLLGTYDDIAAARDALPPAGRRGQKAMARLIWQNHMLYVFAGVAEQWDLAKWFMEGTILLGHVRSGEQDHARGVEDFSRWQHGFEPLRQAPVDQAGTICSGDMPVVVVKLRADLGTWILRQARAMGSRGLAQ